MELPALKPAPVAWLHEITEPDGHYTRILSMSGDNPWAHWLEPHRSACIYKATPLYATPAPPEQEIEGLVERLTKERDEAKANEVYCSKALLRKRSTLSNVLAHMVDEGDRIYFGSTNDADELRDIIDTIEDLEWSKIMASSQAKPDLYGTISGLRKDLAAAEARASTLAAEVERLTGELREARAQNTNQLIGHATVFEAWRARAETAEASLAEALKALTAVAEFDSGDNTILGALHALGENRKIARAALEHKNG